MQHYLKYIFGLSAKMSALVVFYQNGGRYVSACHDIIGEELAQW